MKNNSIVIAVALVIMGVLIASAIYYRPLSLPSAAEQAATSREDNQFTLTNMKPLSAADHRLGAPEAKVTVVEYSDLECPFCKAFQWTMDELLKQNQTQVAWVFRHFPLNIHPKATKEAEAAECAAQLGGEEKFWQYVNKIYEITPSNNGLDPNLLTPTAKGLGLDEKKFAACLDQGVTSRLVADQENDALAIGANGTPFVIVINEAGEKLLPFYQATPATWSPSAKAVVKALLDGYQTNIEKLREQAR